MLLLLLASLAHASEAEELLRQGNLLEALPVAQAEARDQPDDRVTQERWIDLLLGLGRLDDAVRYAKSAVEARPRAPLSHYLEGRAQPTPRESMAAYENALRLNPDYGPAYMGVGAIQRAAGAWREAAESYQRALRLDPSLTEAWTGLLVILTSTTDTATSLQVAVAATEAVPDAPEPWLMRARLDPQHANEHIARAEAQAPWDARVHAERAAERLRADDIPAAAAAASRALALDPSHAEARWVAAVADALGSGRLDREGMIALERVRADAARDPAGMRTLVDQIVTAHPKAGLPLLIRARLRQDAEPQGALDDLAEAHALVPDDLEIGATYGLAMRTTDPALAATLLSRAVRARPDDSSLAVAAAQSLLDAGKGDEALTVASQAAERFPFDLMVGLRYVGVLSAVGQAEPAFRAAADLANRLEDPRAKLAAAAAAKEAELWVEAAERYDALARLLDKPSLANIAAAIRRDHLP